MKTMSFIVALDGRSLRTCRSAISGSPFAACGDSPFLRLGVVTVLALAIGANTAMFALVRAILIRPLPLSEPDRLITFTIVRPGTDRQPLSLLDVQRLRGVQPDVGRHRVAVRVEREPDRSWRRRTALGDAGVRRLLRGHRGAGPARSAASAGGRAASSRRSSVMACGSGASAAPSMRSASRSC